MRSYMFLLLFCWISTILGASQVHHTYDRIVGCLQASGVPQDFPGTEAFTQNIIPLNIRLNFTPIALAVPRTVPQVQSAVRCASELGIKVNPRSGGHSYASHSIGGEDGHLVVDLKYFRETSVDPATNITTIGPGARLGNVAIDLFAQGGRALSFGLCPGVGIGGHVLHGGQGYSSHNHGLLLDSLVEADIVLASGDVVTASENENTDLFWALRGAGMSFGIVTELKFATFEASPEIVLFYYPYYWNQTQARAGWDAWQEYCGGFTVPQIPTELNIRLFIFMFDGLIIFMLGMYVFNKSIPDRKSMPFRFGHIFNESGSFRKLFAKPLVEGAYHGCEDEFLTAIAPLLNALNDIGGLEPIPGYGTHTVGWLDAMAYANNNDLLTGFGSGEGLATPLNYSEHSNFFAKSLMTNNLSPAASDAFINRLYETGPNNTRDWYFLISAQGGPTSVVPKYPAWKTSYAHRNFIYEWQFQDTVTSGLYPNAEGMAWLNPFVSDIENAERKITLGMYYNYADPNLSKHEAHEHYWLSNYERLVQIKRRVDPNMVFENPQTVGN